MKVKKIVFTIMLAMVSMITLASFANADSAMAVFDPDTQCPETSLYKMSKGKPKAEVKTLADCNLTKEDKSLMDTATDIINVILGVIGVVAVAVIVIGGIFYVTSAGDAAKTKKAMHAIIYAIVGLVIALLAFAIVNFVLKSVF